ncbi:MAG: glycosyltransferase [Candidatus Acidiferrum sp.]
MVKWMRQLFKRRQLTVRPQWDTDRDRQPVLMRVLLAFPRPLLPADTGGKIRSLQIFTRLAKRHEIHAISYADPLHDQEGIAAMQRMFATYTSVAWKENAKYSPGFYFDVLANQLSNLPFFVEKCCRPEFAQAMKTISGRFRVDLLLCDFLHTAAAAVDLPLRPRIVFQHNVEFLLRKRQWETESSPLRKWLFAREWKRTQTIEARVCRSFNRVIAVSDEDRRVFEKEFRIQNVSTIPTGVDSEYFHPQEVEQKPGNLAFVGSMDWYPNEDGMLWFLRDVYPLIRKSVPSAACRIIGRNPSAAMSAAVASLAGVELTGRVSDVRPFLAEAEIVIVPLRVGGGTRIKIPEAMAMGKAVVSTTIGAEGLPFRDHRELRLADGPDEFAKAVIQLLLNSEQRKEIERAARECVTRENGWDSVVDRFDEILLALKEEKGSAGVVTEEPTSAKC